MKQNIFLIEIMFYREGFLSSTILGRIYLCFSVANSRVSKPKWVIQTFQLIFGFLKELFYKVYILFRNECSAIFAVRESEREGGVTMRTIARSLMD